ncbi:unnamed protein product [Onchocerca ochengi]|uniref:Cadherin domain-containing protein n=1 Tax=Onchocerca ochengi TaxID=42157 RepID=A0A182E567_ONCOC|nr:unnamed protein product [Onchocerca ochengi]
MAESDLLDYEDPTQRDGFTLGVRVYDGRYYATTKVHIELQDRNDNPPVINGPQYVQLHEDAWLGKQVARFTVQDADANDTAVLLLLITLCTSSSSSVGVVEGQELPQFFLDSLHSRSRFVNFADNQSKGDNKSKSEGRAIVVTLTKNLTEDTPVGTLIATFRARDKDSLTHNLT